MFTGRLVALIGAFSLLSYVSAIGQSTCVSFESSTGAFPVVNNKEAAPILISADDWPGVHEATTNFATDIQAVTGTKPVITNSTTVVQLKADAGSLPTNYIIVGTLGKSSLIKQIVATTSLDVSSIQGKWESFMAKVVKNPLPGVASAYVIIGADKRGTIYGLYDHSEQFGVSPWYWWADVPTTQHPNIFVAPTGCSHGSPTVKYRGIFFNDEQPALESWAGEKFTNGTGKPFNHLFYTKLFELLLRMKGNYLWPAMWGGAFALDDPMNQFLADYYGVVMGTSHQEPMARSTPNEFNVVGKGTWDYTTNTANINQYWLDGAKRAKPFETVFTMGMRGFGDLPLSEETNIGLLQSVIANQTNILQQAYGKDVDVSTIPQVWCLYKEVEGYYEDGMRVPDYITLLWSDDNWGNVRRFPTVDERNRTGGAGIYYHVDYVGDPRDYKWIISSQIEKIYEQMSIAVQRQADRLWILNVGDLKPYERETEFFLSLGWNATRFAPDNLSSYVTQWAQREFDLSGDDARAVQTIVANLTRFNARRKHELLAPTTYSLVNYREADTVLSDWDALEAASTKVFNALPQNFQASFFQMVHHPVLASANLARIHINAGLNNLRASQARFSTNQLADSVEKFFEHDFDLEEQYHTMLNGKWNHIMDQTHIGYFYWQQPMTNSMPPVSRVQTRKANIAGVMRVIPEGSSGAWPGDNPNNCAQGYGCPSPSMSIDNFSPIPNRFVDVAAGGPVSFTFTATSNVPWLTISPSSGSVTKDKPEVRVFATVNDWSKLSVGTTSATIRFVSSAAGQGSVSVPVTFNAVKRAPASGFKGFVEGGGVVSLIPAHANRRTTVQGTAWTEIPNYGKTVSAMIPFPRNDLVFDVGTGPSMEFDFFTFTSMSNNNVNVMFHLSPSLNSNTDKNPLSFAVAIDSQTPVKVTPVGTSPAGGLPSNWGTWVSDAANVVTTTLKAAPGAHTLKVSAVTPGVVIQKIVINTGGMLASYLGPPESLRI